MSALIRHTVRKGSIAIYPRWQTGIATPSRALLDPALHRLGGQRHQGALAYLRARPNRRVQPLVGRASYFGFSFGGIVTANMTNRYRQLQLAETDGQSFSTTRTTVLSRGSASRRLTTPWRASRRP